MVYRLIQDDAGLRVIKGDTFGRAKVKHYKGKFETFGALMNYFVQNYKGTCVGVKTNFNSGERISLLRVVWEGYDSNTRTHINDLCRKLSQEYQNRLVMKKVG